MRRPNAWRPWAPLLCAAIALCAAAAPAQAVEIAEPNDTIAEAYGPLAAGTVYEGNFGSINDVDRLVFYVDGAKQITVSVTKVGAGCSGDITARVLNGDGETISSTVYPNADETETINYTTPGAGHFYVYLTSGCNGDPYRVTIGPGDAIAGPPPGDPRPTTQTTPTAEPSDDIAHTFGPLAPATAYAGDFGTVNDRDWLAFYVNGPRQLHLHVTKVGDGCSGDIAARVLDGDGKQITSTIYPNDDQRETTSLTTPGAGRYYVHLSNECAGDPYQVRLEPGDAIVTQSPFQATAPSPAPEPLAEPNDTAAAAIQLGGGVTYGAAIDTPNDQDWYSLIPAVGRQLDIAVTKVGDGCSGDVTALLTDADDQRVGTIYPNDDQIQHFRFSPTKTGRYLLKLSSSCAGNPYQLRIDPGDALLATLPPPTVQLTGGGPTATTERGRGGRRVVVITVAGRLRVPPGVAAASACRGQVVMTVSAGRKLVTARNTKVGRTCRYKKVIRFPRSRLKVRRVVVRVRFPGNSRMGGADVRSTVRIRKQF